MNFIELVQIFAYLMILNVNILTRTLTLINLLRYL